MNYEAIEVAKWILIEAKNQGIFMSHMKLQKLLYYVQAYFIAITGKPLFPNHIKAWQHGPVVPDVYHYFKKYGNSKIIDIDDITIPNDIAPLIAAVIHDKGHLSASELRELTHNEDTWKNAWYSLDKKDITNEMIAKYFSQDFWTSDEEDFFQPSFDDKNEENKFFKNNITDEEINAILASR